MQNDLSLVKARDGMAQVGEYTISDLARFYDVSLRTLRFYEDKGLLNPRRHGTSRFYRSADRLRLELILKGKKLGFTLSEIFELISSRTKQSVSGIAEESADLTVSLDHRQITAQIAHLERQRKDLDDAIEELRHAYDRMMTLSA